MSVTLQGLAGHQREDQHENHQHHADRGSGVGVPCSMPFWYITNTGDAEAPSGPPPLVSRYGSVNRLAPVMVARMTTSVVAGRTPGTVTFQNAFTAGAVDRGGLVQVLRHVLQRGEVEQDVEAELLPGHEQRDHGIASLEFTSHDGFGASGPSIWLTIPLLLNRNSHTATSATLAVTYGT
jgi:hypothetical protein